MALKIPDLLQYEMRHRLERVQSAFEQWGLREWIDRHAGAVIAVASLSVVLLGFVLIRVLWPARPAPVVQSRLAWFYDANTGRLFTGSFKQGGPIAAPSGPLPEGGPAGFRAHVYSYVLEPSEAELFVGFLERPDPSAGAKARTELTDFRPGPRDGRRRVKDDRFATSRRASDPARPVSPTPKANAAVSVTPDIKEPARAQEGIHTRGDSGGRCDHQPLLALSLPRCGRARPGDRPSAKPTCGSSASSRRPTPATTTGCFTRRLVPLRRRSGRRTCHTSLIPLLPLADARIGFDTPMRHERPESGTLWPYLGPNRRARTIGADIEKSKTITASGVPTIRASISCLNTPMA